jgi:hypothetical protein
LASCAGPAGGSAFGAGALVASAVGCAAALFSGAFWGSGAGFVAAVWSEPSGGGPSELAVPQAVSKRSELVRP